MRIRLRALPATLFAAALLVLGARGASAGNGTLPQLAPPFDDTYSITNLGAVPDLPVDYGGITFFSGSTGSLLIGGLANEQEAGIYQVPASRDAEGHITTLGSAVRAYNAPFIDGGLAYGPGGVLFYSRYHDDAVGIGEIFGAPSGSVIQAVIDLAPLNVAESPGGLNFVPAGFPGAGQLKLTSYSDGDWYSLEIAPVGDIFDVVSASKRADLDDGKEGFVFVPLGSPAFGTNPQVLINEYDDDSMSAFELDINGDPIPGSRQPFITGLDGPDGAMIDPLTGDLLITEFRGNRVFRVDGFALPFRKGDNNCDGLVNAVDALAALRRVAGLLVSQQPGCPALAPDMPGLVPQVNGAALFGDVDCDHDLDAVDALHILRYVAFLPVNLPFGCTPFE